LRIEPNTKELQYHLNTDNVNDAWKTINGGPIYFNDIEQTTIDVRGHLLIRYSSTKYRPTTSITDPAVSNEGHYKKIIVNPNNIYPTAQTWIAGTSDYKIEGTSGVWWHDVGVVLNKAGVQIITEYEYLNDNNSGITAPVYPDNSTLMTRIIIYIPMDILPQMMVLIMMVEF